MEEKFETFVLDNFTMHWVALFSKKNPKHGLFEKKFWTTCANIFIDKVVGMLGDHEANFLIVS